MSQNWEAPQQTPTLPKTNIAPKNGGFQWESTFPGIYFQVLCLVLGRVSNT